LDHDGGTEILAEPVQAVTAPSLACDHGASEPDSDSLAATLLFFHIGKTGGTSLTHYFRAFTTRFHVQPAPDDYSGLQASDGNAPLDFISGHYSVDPWLYRLPRSWRTMVVIRNPITHLLSTYWHIRTHPPAENNPGLRDLIESAGRFDPGALLLGRAGKQFEVYFDNPQTRFLLNKASGPLDADDLSRALALLSSLNYVGTTERLGDFAAAVAAETPWAIGWREQVLPHAMVNPLNTLRIEEIPREVLRPVLAATEFDAELHQHAGRLQSERLDSAARISATSVQVRSDPNSMPRVIAVADLIRVFPLKLQHVRPGHELSIKEEEIILHPPAPGDDRAEVTIEDIWFDRQSELAGRLMLGHERAAPVLFDIDLSQETTVLASASYKVAYGQPLDIRVRFSPATGPVRLTLRTAVADAGSNAFAWATFVGLAIS
jgi:hypothetical protein